jgi:RNA polymerase sigma factor (sigma-70 family)
MKLFKNRNKENTNLETVLYDCSRGNRKSQEQLYKMHYSYAMSIALRFSNNRESAAEILNDSFLKTFHYLSEGGKIDNFMPWLRKTIINNAIDYYRRNSKFTDLIAYDEHLPETVFDDNIIANLTAEEIIATLQKLSDVHRVIFILYEIEGYSHKEIGEKLGISEIVSRKNLSRAKNQLKMLFRKTKIYEYSK